MAERMPCEASFTDVPAGCLEQCGSIIDALVESGNPDLAAVYYNQSIIEQDDCDHERYEVLTDYAVVPMLPEDAAGNNRRYVAADYCDGCYRTFADTEWPFRCVLSGIAKQAKT